MRIASTSELIESSRPVGRIESSLQSPLQSGLPLRMRNGVPEVVERPSQNGLAASVKRAFDFSMALLALAALSPLLLFLAAAVRLSSPGPVLFRQTRLGRGEVPFTIYKFRTMYQEAADPTGVRQVTAADPGITTLGRLMRSKSLDELPQLFNVLRGDMSLVGPRPHAIGMKAAGLPYDVMVPYYHMRHSVRPGLSGWAQANGLRGPTLDARMARARVDHDIAYIQNQSLLLDLKIIALTIKHEFLTGSGH